MTSYNITVIPLVPPTLPTTWLTSPDVTTLVPDLLNDVQYTFNVSAGNVAGYGPSASCGCAIIPPGSVQPPDVVTGLVVQPLVRAVSLSWVPPANADVFPVSVYTVVYTLGDNATAVNVTTVGCVVAIPPPLTYEFTVQAWNAAGPGPVCDPVPGFAYEHAFPPSPPFIVSVEGGDGSVAVSWHMPLYASSPVTNCSLYCTPSPTGRRDDPVATLAFPIDNDVVAPLVNGVGYVFAVSCANVAGSSALSPPSPVVTPGTIPVGPPGPPQLPYVSTMARSGMLSLLLLLLLLLLVVVVPVPC